MITRRCSFLLASCASLTLCVGCLPEPKSVGDDPAEDDADHPDAGETGDDGGPADTAGPDADEWSHLFPAQTYIFEITSMFDGGIAAIEHRHETYEYRIIRYEPSGSIAWQVDFGSSRVRWLHALDDGGLIVAGARGSTAALWRLSPTGTIEAEYSHPKEGVPGERHSEIAHLAATSTGMAFIVRSFLSQEDGVRWELWWADSDFSPQWSWMDFEGFPYDLAVMPGGEIRVIEGPTSHEVFMRGFDADGTPAWVEDVPAHTGFADEDPLVLLEPIDEGWWMHGEAGTAAIDVVLPGGPWTATHKHGVATVGVTDGGSLSVLQYEDDGALVRDVALSPLELEFVTFADVAVAPDGALWISGHEQDGPPESSRGFIRKLPPL